MNHTMKPVIQDDNLLVFIESWDHDKAFPRVRLTVMEQVGYGGTWNEHSYILDALDATKFADAIYVELEKSK